MELLLAISDKYDPSGVLCLAAIPVLILASIPFRKGVISPKVRIYMQKEDTLPAIHLCILPLPSYNLVYMPEQMNYLYIDLPVSYWD